MAYDVNTDYKAQNEALKKQLAAATDEATKAALQAQIDANDASRTEKIASDLTKYGKYATDSELDSAAGLQAENQIGTTYDTKAKSINSYFDTAKQNANNNALSRGMARSSFVQDRQANLDVERANSLTENDAAKALAIQNAKQTILSDYRTGVANEATAEYNKNLNKAETLAQYGDVSGYKDVGYNDAQIAAMNKYLAEQAALAAAKAASGSGSGSGTTKPKLTAAQALAAYDEAGIRTPEVIAAYAYYYGDPDYDPAKTPTYSTPRTANYGSQTVQDVNDRINAGYTPQEVIAAAKEKYGVGSKEYNDIVSAALRQR